jgi:hypothetical protein
MRLDHIDRPPAPVSTSGLAPLCGTLALAVVVLVGCSSGAAQDSRIDQSRDAGLPDKLAAVQATRTVEKFFPSTATPSATKPPPAAMGSLVITFGFRSDGTPDGSYASVPAGVGTAYAAAELSGLAAGEVVRAIVIDGWGNEIAKPEVAIEPGAADRWLALPIGLPAEVAPGEYGVFVFVDDRPLGSLAFGVTAPGTSAQLLPELPANPQVRATLPPPGAAPVEGSTTPTVVPTT